MKRNSVTLCGALVASAFLAMVPLASAAPNQESGHLIRVQAKRQATQGNSKRGTTKDRGSAMQRFAKELNLTKAQQARIEPIIRETSKQVRAIRSDKSLSKEQKLERLKKLQASSVRRINSVLNAQQRKKFAAMLQKMRQRHQAMQR